MAYAKAQIIEKTNEAIKNPGLLYKKDFVNYKGRVSDENRELYSEIIAECLINRISQWKNNIHTITRSSTYIIESHKGCAAESNSTRGEPIFVQKMFVNKNSEFPNLGKCIDYEIPLKNKSDDEGVGKIDIAIWNQNNKVLCLGEFKHYGNTETLLRAVLECATYKSWLNVEKFQKDIESSKLQDDLREAASSGHLKIVWSVIATNGCLAYEQILDPIGNAKVHELSKLLDIDLKVYDVKYIPELSIPKID